MRKAICALTMAALMAAPQAVWAANAATPAAAPVMAVVKTAPDPAANALINSLLKQGAKAYFLGSKANLDGWFVVKDGQVQVIYTSPDGKFALAGVLFGSDEDNITAAQMGSLIESNAEVKALLGAANAQVNSATAGAAPVTAAAPQQVMAQQNTAPAQAHASTGERLLQDLSGATSVDLGPAGTPQLFMVMDPGCPHCKATWKALRETVMKNALQVRLVPIANPDSDTERAAARLLHTADPLGSWDKYAAGDKTELAGSADPKLVQAVRANHELTDSWNIEATPFMVYRGKDGKVKIFQGELDSAEKTKTLLADLGL